MDSRNDNGPLSSDVAHLCRVAQTPAIPKTNLQTICVVNGLPKTGNKAALQRRIVDRKYSSSGASPIIRACLSDSLPPNLHLGENDTSGSKANLYVSQ